MVQELLADGYLGDLLGRAALDDAKFVDKTSLCTGGRTEMSGYNALNMGIWYEALMRWLGPATKVMAMTKVCVNQRRDANGILRRAYQPCGRPLEDGLRRSGAPRHQRRDGSGAQYRSLAAWQ